MSRDSGFIPDLVLERKAYKLLSEFEARFGKIAEPTLNTFNGRTSVELKLRDVQLP